MDYKAKLSVERGASVTSPDCLFKETCYMEKMICHQLKSEEQLFNFITCHLNNELFPFIQMIPLLKLDLFGTIFFKLQSSV